MSFLFVDPTDNALVVQCGYEQKTSIANIGGCWDSVNKVWRVVFTIENLETILNTFPDISVSPDLEERVKKQMEKEEKLGKLRSLAKQNASVNIRIPGLKLPLKNYQKLGVMYAITNKVGLLLADEMGLGKSEVVDNKVFTTTGRCRIGDLKVGDEVIGKDGKPHNVVGIYPQGLQDIYRVWFNDGFYLDVGPEHLWEVTSNNQHNKKRTSKGVVLSMSQLLDKNGVSHRIGDGYNNGKSYEFKTYYKKDNGNNAWGIPIVKAIDFEQAKVSIDPYMLGVWLGDGHIYKNGYVALRMLKADLEEMPIGGKPLKSKIPHMKIIAFNGYKKELTDYGLNGKRAWEKFIPKEYKYNTLEVRLGILQGLMDTDGNAADCATEYSTTSKRLADDVAEIVQTLGGIARIRIKEKPSYSYKGVKKYGRLSYRVNIKLPAEMDLFRLKRKIADYDKCSKYSPARYICKIEKLSEKKQTICISVDAPDQLYVTEHCIVTHNTLQGIGAALFMKNYEGAKKALIVTPASLKFNWPLEIEKFTDEKYVVIHGTPDERIAQWIRKDVFFYIVNYELLLEDLFGGRTLKEREGETFEQKERRESMMSKAKRRQGILSEIRKTIWDILIVDECFHSNTQISLADGTQIPISMLVKRHQNDKVLSFNQKTKKIEPKSIIGWYRNSGKMCYRMLTDGGISYPTENHKYMTPKGYRRVKELNVGDIVLVKNEFTMSEDHIPPMKNGLCESTIKILEPYERVKTTYNIEVADNHNYFAGNTLVSNCQSLKHHSSKRTKNVKELKARFRMALTGTPMDGRLEELHSLMQFVASGLLLSKDRFFQRHVETDFWGRVTGYKRIGEVTQKIQPFFLRRLKKDVLKDLPDKVYENRIITLSTEEMKVYKSLAENGHKMTEDASALTAIIRCKQFCDWNPMVDDACKANSKMEAFKEVLDEVILQNGHKALVFSQYKTMLDIIVPVLNTMGIKFMRIDGDTPPKDRADMQKKFNEDKSIDLMIGTEAMSAGLNFQSADYVINYDDNWSPAIMAQREDRCLTGENMVFCQHADGHYDLSRIDNIVVGDKITTHLGQERIISKVSSHEHRGMITRIGYTGWWAPLVCTYDHKVFIKREEKLMWVEAHTILPSDSMVFPKTKNWIRLESVVIQDKWRLFPKRAESCIICGDKITARQMCEYHYRKWVKENRGKYKPGTGACGNGRYVSLPDIIQVDNQWLKLFGWYVAEGFSSITKGKGRFVSLSGHQDELPVLMEFGKIFDNLGIKWTIYTPKNTKGIELRAYSGELALWFMDWFGHMAKNKTLPKELQNLPPDQAEVLLNKYTDGDGYYRGKQVEWVSASKTLCYQMGLLAIRSGFNPNMRRVLCKDGRTHHFIGSYTENPNPCNKKFAYQDEDYVYHPVKSVTTERDKIRVYDLSIEEEDHSFVCGLSSVHNCHRNGQKNVVTVINFICKDTIEERIRGVIYAKNRITSQTLGDETEDMVLKRLGPKDLAKLL